MVGVSNLKNPLATLSLLGVKFLLIFFSSVASITPFYLKTSKILLTSPLALYLSTPSGWRRAGCGTIFQSRVLLLLNRGQSTVNVSTRCLKGGFENHKIALALPRTM